MRASPWLIGLFVVAGLAGCFGPPDDGSAQYGSTVQLGLALQDAATGREILPMQEDLSGPVVLQRGHDPFGLPGLARAVKGAQANETLELEITPDARYDEVRASRFLADLDATQEVRRADLVARIDPLEAQNLQAGLRIRWTGGYRYEVTSITGEGANTTVALAFVGPSQTAPLFTIGANVTATLDGTTVHQALEPMEDGLWVKVNSPFAPASPLQVPEGIYRHKGLEGDELVMAHVPLDIDRLGHLFDDPLQVTVKVGSVQTGAADPYARPAERLANHGARDSPHIA